MYYNQKCIKILTTKDCLIFSKPNSITRNTSCIPLTTKERNELCKKQKKVYYHDKCLKIRTTDDCKKDTSCRLMTNKEKEKICT